VRNMIRIPDVNDPCMLGPLTTIGGRTTRRPLQVTHWYESLNCSCWVFLHEGY